MNNKKKFKGGYHARLAYGFRGNEEGGLTSRISFADELVRAVDIDTAYFYRPPLDQLIRRCAEEVNEEKQAGVLRPFIEGEPIGQYQKRPVPVNIGSYAQLWESRRAEMLKLRARNDREMEKHK